MREDHAVRTRLTRVCALPGLRAAAAALALVTVVTGIGTAAAGGSGGTPGLITTVTTVAPDQAAAAVIAAARTHLGQKYVFGGTGPTIWDCSGLTSFLWRTAGGVAAIPRTARLQQAWATPVPASQVLPGDLYFLGTPATHVGIVLGAGMVLDASASHGKVVERALWTATDITFGRVPRAGAVPVTAPPAGQPTTPAPTTTPITTPTAPTPPVVTSPPSVAAGKPIAPTLAPSASGFVAAAKALVGAPYSVGGTGPLLRRRCAGRCRLAARGRRSAATGP